MTEISKSVMRPEISLAWRRAALTGLDPGTDIRETAPLTEVDRRSRLAMAATPVLDRMIGELADTRFSVLIADRTSTIIDRRITESGVGRALDRVLAVPGSRYVEEVSGTNSIATAYELQRPIAVTGEEHFLEALRVFCCFGAPIFHPITRRLEGVLDVSGPAADSTGLLGPFLMHAVRDIEQRLLEGSRAAEQRLLTEFQTHSRNRSHAVLVFGESLVLCNRAATDLVQTTDYELLRGLAGEIGGGILRQPLTLRSGSQVMVTATAVPDSPGGVLFDVVPTVTAEIAPGNGRAALTAPTIRAHVTLVTGEPGSGRTTRGFTIAGPNAAVVACADEEFDHARLDRALELLRTSESVLIDDIHALPARFAARLTAAIPRAPGRVVMTSSPVDGLDSEQAALAALALDRHESQPVRDYHTDFVRLTESVLRELLPESELRITPSALRILATHRWPGNIRELRAVLEFAARGRARGDITEQDLPPTHRRGPTRALSRMETAERDAILAALRAAGGNRVTAAKELGIGRTTLYDRLRRYDINE